MAGSISLSLSQQFDSTGAPLNGGLLYFFSAGTTTPQSAYQDSSLTLAWPNPIVLDSAGRVPPFYLADGQIKIRLANADGVTQVSADNLLVVGASSGSGTAPTVDATKIYQTGDLKPRYGTGAHTGWVRSNGRTIGSATSGASERANADCQDLFEYLWAADTTLSVSTGRGASANADWVANKTIALPDARGRAFFSADDMGNSAAGRLTLAGSGVDGLTLGAAGGVQNRTLAQSNLPNVTLTYSGVATVVSTSSNIGQGTISSASNGTGSTINPFAAGAIVGQITSTGSSSGNTASINGGVTQGTLNIMNPAFVITTYIKL